MVMLPPEGKAKKIAARVMKNEGIKQPKKKGIAKTVLTGPYLQR